MRGYPGQPITSIAVGFSHSNEPLSRDHFAINAIFDFIAAMVRPLSTSLLAAAIDAGIAAIQSDRYHPVQLDDH